MINLQKKEEKGITLVALVITIIVLIILAGIAINMTIGENGIFTRAKEAKRLQITAEAKEKIGADILDAQIEATQKDEELQQSKLEEIIAKYGELQADGDTIKLKDSEYTISLSDVYRGKLSNENGTKDDKNSSDAIEIYHPKITQGNSTVSIPEKYKNGTLFLIDAYDQRSHNVPKINGKTAKYTSTNAYGHSYVNVILIAYDLENDSSVDIEWTKSNNNNAIDVFIIKDDANVEYLSSSIDNSNSISVEKGKRYIYCGLCDYRQTLSVSSPSAIFSRLKTNFSTSTDIYMQSYYCVYLGIVETLEDETFSIGAATNQVGLYFKIND